MITHFITVLRSALALLSARLLLKQIGLALLVFALFVLWLRMPDASVIDVIGSVFLGLIVLAVAGAGESWIIQRLADNRPTRLALLRGALLLLVGVALWFGWSALIDHLSANDALRAGYLNSKFPHSSRNFFSFRHILLWLAWMWSALKWVGAGVIALFVFAATANLHPARAITSAVRSGTYWVALILVTVGTLCATMFTASLMQWRPYHGLRTEMFSVALRLLVVVLVDAAVACLLLAILAVCVRRGNSGGNKVYSTPAGTPDESQPRTVEGP